MEREIRRKKRNVRGTRNIFIAAVAAVIIAVFIIAIRGQVKENENYISRALASRMLVHGQSGGCAAGQCKMVCKIHELSE